MKGKKIAKEGKRLLCLLLAGLCFLGAPGCAREEPVQAQVPSTQPTQAQPELAVTGNGDPESLLCKGTYTGSNLESSREETVAEAGGCVLTLGQLRIRYALAVSEYRQSGKTPAPDFERSLENQPCPLAEGLSWQHWFLRAALEQWHAQAALLGKSREIQTVSSEYYEPSRELHEANMTEDIPAKKYLYEDKNGFTPNSMHQAWLDALPETLAALGTEKGYSNLAKLVSDLAGAGAGEDDLLTVAREMNLSYMYYTQCSYDFDVSGEELSGDEQSVDIRHCLLLPETEDEEGLRRCRQEAEDLLAKWENHWMTARNREGNFARLVNDNSDDENSRELGGLYTGIRQGQLIAPLDAWCFDEARQPGDVAVIQSDIGCHILYFRGATQYGEGEKQRFRDAGKALLETLKAEYPMTVDYSAVSLGTPENVVDLSSEEFLYPDVAHERFPEPILFLQQDYPNAPYGDGYYIERHGCGITVLAMLASYMTDSLYTPDVLADRYSIYSIADGSDGTMFINVPQEFGFFLEQHDFRWENVSQALKEGKTVVSLQGKGYFTTVGHFILLAGINDDGTVVVRDPNINAYGKLEENKIDAFSPSRIYNANIAYYIMKNKVTVSPDCCRCGSGEGSKVLTGSYLCERCTQALLRRESFLTMCAGM